MNPNLLKRALQAGMSEDDLALLPDNELAKLLAPMPTAPNVAPMQQNTMRFENGPDQGRVVSMNFAPPQAPQSQAFQAPQGAPQPQQMRVVGAGNGATVDLSPEASGPVAIDYSRPPVDVPGVGKAFYSKDGRGAYVLNGQGQPTTKVILGYDMAGSMALNKANLEREKTQAEIQHTNAATAELGAPKYQLTPEGDVFDPKSGRIVSQGAQNGQTQRAMQKAAYTQGLKELEQDDKEATNYSSIEQALKRFQELNAKVSSGRIMGSAPVNAIAAIGNPERQEMEKIQSFLAMNNFKPGQGQMSNFERALIQKGGPNLANDEATNHDIVTAQLGLIQDARDHSAFRQAYLQSHGNLVGAEQQWQQYRQANPVVMQDQSGRVMVNPQRQTWMDFFAGAGSNQPASPMQTERPNAAAKAPGMGDALPMPSTKSNLIPGQFYRTPRGVARWNGSVFEQ